MELVFAVILLALVEYIVFTGLVGRARGKYKVPAPAMTGHPDFERANRVHQNTLESLIVFIPALWIFGLYLSHVVGAVLGVVVHRRARASTPSATCARPRSADPVPA